MRGIFIFFLGVILSLALVSAGIEVGFEDSVTDGIEFVDIIIPPTPTNYSLISTVNSSDFWDNLNTPTDINVGDLGDGSEYAKYQFTNNNFNGSGNFTGSYGFFDRVGIGVSPLYDLQVGLMGIDGANSLITRSIDPNTYFQFSGVDMWSFVAGDVGMIRGWENPTQNEIRFNYDNEDVDFIIDGNTNDNVFFVDGANERVGIGIDSPVGRLSVYAENAGDPVVVYRDPNRFADIRYLAIATNHFLIQAGGSDKLSFSSNFSATPHMTIDTAGNVGIGTDSPDNLLSIYNDDAQKIGSQGMLIEQDGTGDATLRFLLTGGRSWRIGIDNTDDSFSVASNVFIDDDLTKNLFKISDNGDMTLNALTLEGGVITQNSKLGSDNIFDIYNMILDRGGGVGGIGLGMRWVMHLENGAGDTHEAGGIQLEWADATAGSEDSTMTLQTYVAGSVDSSLVIKGGNVGIGTTSPTHTLNVVGDVNVTGTIFTSDLNISNSSFSFMDDENSSIRYSVQNKNSGTNATSLITAINDAGNVMGIGIGSSNYLLGSLLMPNVTGLYSRSRGDSVFLNFYKQAFIWMFNPSDDNDPNNLVQLMKLDEGGLNVSGNITSENSFISQYIFAHNNATMTLASANVWANLTFDQEDAEIKKGINHTFNDNTNHTFTINQKGIYDIDFNFDAIDTSASSTDIDVAGRVIYSNGTEITGSVFETDIAKKNIEIEISHSILAKFEVGDVIVFQFTASDVDVVISTHGTFGVHPESATIRIEKVANL